MGAETRRGSYLATTEGVKKLKEAKRLKKYTYEQIKNASHVTVDQVKWLFNPQRGNGQYKIGEDAVSLIGEVFELRPEEILEEWYAIDASDLVETEEELREEDAPYARKFF